MRTTQLGKSELQVSAIGLGCMGMSDFYGPTDEQDVVNTLLAALDLGVNFWDTSDMYGPHRNELLLGRALRDSGKRDQVVLATKFGIMREANGATTGVNGRPEYVRQCCEASLQRLGVDHIDLYYQHRVDPAVPIEETVGAMAELVVAGKVRYLGLSEANAETLRRAYRVHPITALQSEYSLWSQDIATTILPTCAGLDISLVAYGPLGRGFLTGRFHSTNDFAADDWRLHMPRFTPENIDRNLQLLEIVKQLAEQKNATPAQIALAWLLHQPQSIVPIPGTRRVERLKENAGAVDVSLSAEEVDMLSAAFNGSIHGARYPEIAMKLIQQ